MHVIFNQCRRHGFTLVEIMVVVAVIAILCAIAIPNLVSARERSQANACINNLRTISDASDEFALDNKKHTGDRVRLNKDLTPYIKLSAVTGRIPACPAGGAYSDHNVGETPLCSLGDSVTPAHALP